MNKVSNWLRYELADWLALRFMKVIWGVAQIIQGFVFAITLGYVFLDISMKIALWVAMKEWKIDISEKNNRGEQHGTCK